MDPISVVPSIIQTPLNAVPIELILASGGGNLTKAELVSVGHCNSHVMQQGFSPWPLAYQSM